MKVFVILILMIFLFILKHDSKNEPKINVKFFTIKYPFKSNNQSLKKNRLGKKEY